MRLIDADALIDEVDGDLLDSIAEGRAIEKIMNAPTIEERKKGKWVYHDDDDMRFDTYHCSSCRKLFTVDAERFDDIGFVKEDLKYCPNCWADMRGGEK